MGIDIHMQLLLTKVLWIVRGVGVVGGGGGGALGGEGDGYIWNIDGIKHQIFFLSQRDFSSRN